MSIPTIDTPQDRTDHRDVTDLVGVLADSVLAVAARADRPPLSVRVAAGALHIEVTWPQGEVAVVDTVRAPEPRTAPASVRQPEPVAASAAESGTFVVSAGTVGVFYRCPEPGAKPFIEEGDAVVPGRQVGIVEAMKMMIPVEADRAGVVVEILVPDATSVEYGQPLILLREADK